MRNCSEIVKVQLKPLNLALRTAFGTSHASTTSRLNALIEFELFGLVGFGEAGLPPKKPGCYEADFQDVQAFFQKYCDKLDEELKTDGTLTTGDPFQHIPDEYCHLFRQASDWQGSVYARRALMVLDGMEPQGITPSSRPARNAIEAAILDCWSQGLGHPLRVCLGLGAECSHAFCFYTVAMGSDSEMQDSAQFGSQYTVNIKLKVNEDIQQTEKALNILQQLVPAHGIWTVDANSAWTPQISTLFIDIAKKFPLIKIVEQPFPLALKTTPADAPEWKEWEKVKQLYEQNGLQLFADESIAIAKDVDTLKGVIHGVNVKLDKAGGLRGGIQVLTAAKKYGLSCWMGTMVCSMVGATTVSQLLPLAQYADVDGPLLLTAECQKQITGGFTWKEDKSGHIHMPLAPGNGVQINI